MTLLDTAGMRSTVDTVEAMGVERSERAASDAEAIVFVYDSAVRVTCDVSCVLLERTHDTALHSTSMLSSNPERFARRCHGQLQIQSSLTEFGPVEMKSLRSQPY